MGKTSFLSKIDKGYNDLKIKSIKKIAGINSDNLLQESPFFDSGYIKTQVKNLKEEFSTISNEINSLYNSFSKDELKNTNINELIRKKNKIIYNIVFLSSNSFKNLNYCLKLLNNLDLDFEICIYGLKEYQKGNNAEAFQYLNEYLGEQEILLDHYLINKVYGLLLMKTEQYKLARLYLLKAVEKKPADIEIHRLLKKIHEHLNEEFAADVEKNIIELLEE